MPASGIEDGNGIIRRVCQQIATSRISGFTAGGMHRTYRFISRTGGGRRPLQLQTPYVTNAMKSSQRRTPSGGGTSLTDTTFVPNDTYLSNKDTQLVILTGPNMAGKSTYLKAGSVIVLTGAEGSFVPADEPLSALSTAFFTRIGARENLAGDNRLSW